MLFRERLLSQKLIWLDAEQWKQAFVAGNNVFYKRLSFGLSYPLRDIRVSIFGFN